MAAIECTVAISLEMGRLQPLAPRKNSLQKIAMTRPVYPKLYPRERAYSLTPYPVRLLPLFSIPAGASILTGVLANLPVSAFLNYT